MIVIERYARNAFSHIVQTLFVVFALATNSKALFTSVWRHFPTSLFWRLVLIPIGIGATLLGAHLLKWGKVEETLKDRGTRGGRRQYDVYQDITNLVRTIALSFVLVAAGSAFNRMIDQNILRYYPDDTVEGEILLWGLWLVASVAAVFVVRFFRNDPAYSISTNGEFIIQDAEKLLEEIA